MVRFSIILKLLLKPISLFIINILISLLSIIYYALRVLYTYAKVIHTSEQAFGLIFCGV